MFDVEPDEPVPLDTASGHVPPDDPPDTGCGAEVWTVKAGTKLSWKLGGDAGVVRTDYEFSNTEMIAERMCFSSNGLDLCGEKSSMSKKTMPCAEGEDVWGGLH